MTDEVKPDGQDEAKDGSLTDALTCGDRNLETTALQVFDAVRGLPPKVQHIMALKSFGWSNLAIAKELGYKDSRWIARLLDRWDPNRISERGDAVRKMIISNASQRVAFEAIRTITAEELGALPPDTRMKVAKDAVKIVADLRAHDLSNDKDMQKAILDIKSWVVDKDGKQVDLDAVEPETPAEGEEGDA